jgi:hypothetical protein
MNVNSSGNYGRNKQSPVKCGKLKIAGEYGKGIGHQTAVIEKPIYFV